MKTQKEHALIIVLVIVSIIGSIAYYVSLGIGSMGPTRNWNAVQVMSKHTDITDNGDKRTTHYMVTTDAGTFEVQNGIFLGVWNADELFGMMSENGHYDITTKGNRVVGMFFQEYPYITSVNEAKVDEIESD